MGSSHSRPSPSTSHDPPTSRTGLRRRLEPLRRISTLGRRHKRYRESRAPSPDAQEGNRDGEDDTASISGLASTGTNTTVEGPTLGVQEAQTEESSNINSPPPPAQIVPEPELEQPASRILPTDPIPPLHYPVRRPTSPAITPPQRYLPARASRHGRSSGLRRSLNIPDWNTSVNVSRRRSWDVSAEAGPSGQVLPSPPDALTTMPMELTPSTPAGIVTSPVEPSTSPGSIDTPTTTSANTLASTIPLRPQSTSTTLPPVLHRTRSEPAFGTPLIPLDPPSNSDDHIRRMRVEQGFLGEEVSQLRQQLEVSRAELAQAVTDAAAAESNLRNLEAQDPGGAVMMIQGIAQTHIPIISRRRLGRWRSRDRERGERRVPFEEQASTIIGLILVASLATANTLLSTERPRPRPNTLLETLMRRIQPSRAFAVETLLSDPSISSHSRSNRRRSTATTNPESTGDLNMPSEFTDWLNTLQSSIRDAMREFVEGTTLPISRTTSVQHTEVERPGTERRISAPTPTLNQLVLDSSIGDTIPQATQQSHTRDSIDEISQAESSSTEVPQFHPQAGQTTTTGHNQTGVTTDANGVRSLSFFRAHIFAAPEGANAMVPCLFVGVRSTNQDPATFGVEGGRPFSEPTPATPSDGTAPTALRDNGPEREVAGPTASESTAPPDSEPAPIATASSDVPHDSLSSDGAERGELLPTIYRSRMGRVPMSSPNGGPERESTTQTSPVMSRTQALRSRLLALSPFSSHQRSHTETDVPETPPSHRVDRQETQVEPEPQATFIMYVIGGNFPRNHPVLRIPGLITGEPLTDEEMVLMGELLGEAKPPTATAEEVEQSGLKVVRGSEILALVEGKQVLEGSADRCLVCLSDFEEEEECRILSCRHVFHKECVDQWIKIGRNACPACRTEAVDRKAKVGPETATQPGSIQANEPVTRSEPDVPTGV